MPFKDPKKNREYQRNWRRKYVQSHSSEVGAYQKQYNETHREQRRALRKQWRKNNPDKVKESGKKQYHKKRDKNILRVREWRKEHRKEIREYKRKYRKEHPEQEERSKRKYAEKNPERIKIRLSPRYAQWRFDVFKRDNWTCQECGYKGHKIEAHHNKKGYAQIIKEYNIKNYTDALKCKELWDLNNGQTLCEDCHNLTKNRKCLKC